MLQTEFNFIMPKGYIDDSGTMHKNGIMRLATAADEILPMRDPRVQQNPEYLMVILISRVVTKLGSLPAVDTKTIERMFTADLAYLKDLYHRINYCENPVYKAVCPKCGKECEFPIHFIEISDCIKDEKNNIKYVKTKSGHTVQFVDAMDKAFIEIITAGNLAIKLDDKAKTVTLSGSGGDNKIILNENNGEIAFFAKNRVSFMAGNATLTLDGQGKSAEIKADTVTVKPSQTLTLSGNQIKVDGQQLQVKGQTVAVEAGAHLDLKSSGTANLKGAMVKIN